MRTIKIYSMIIALTLIIFYPLRSNSQQAVICTSNPSFYCAGSSYPLFAYIGYPDYTLSSANDWSIYSSTGSVTLTVDQNFYYSHLSFNTPNSSAVIAVTYYKYGQPDGTAYGYFEAQHIHPIIPDLGCVGENYYLFADIQPVVHIADFQWTFPNNYLFNGFNSPYSTGTPANYTSGTLSVGNNATSGNICLNVTNAGCTDVGFPVCQYMNVSASAPSQPGDIRYEINGLPCPDNHWDLWVNGDENAFYYTWTQFSNYFLLDQSTSTESELIIKHNAYDRGTTVYVTASNGCGESPYRSRSFISLSEEQCSKKANVTENNFLVYPNPAMNFYFSTSR